MEGVVVRGLKLLSPNSTVTYLFPLSLRTISCDVLVQIVAAAQAVPPALPQGLQLDSRRRPPQQRLRPPAHQVRLLLLALVLAGADQTLRPFCSEHCSQASSKPLAVYLGVDPTATSLHAGNLLAMLGLLHFHIRGHQAIALASPPSARSPLVVSKLTLPLSQLTHCLSQIGGATGTIGDPSGRSSERTFLEPDQLATNVASITAQYQRFLFRGQAYANARLADTKLDVVGPMQEPKVVNNMDWFGEMSLLDFLRGTGKRARVQTMLAKDRYVLSGSPPPPHFSELTMAA